MKPKAKIIHLFIIRTANVDITNIARMYTFNMYWKQNLYSGNQEKWCNSFLNGTRLINQR